MLISLGAELPASLPQNSRWINRTLAFPAARGNAEMLEVLLQKPVSHRLWSHAISVAVSHNREETARMLLAVTPQGTPDNAPDLSRHLMGCAVRSASPDILASLFKAGFSTPGPDDNGATLMHLAALREQDAGEMSRMLAAEGGLDVNACDQAGRTPLFWAARGGREVAAHELLANGADHTLADAAGVTPEHAAKRSGHSLSFMGQRAAPEDAPSP